MRAVRVAVVVFLLVAVAAALMITNQPSLAISLYALIPIVLGAFWFDLRAALLIAAAAVLLFLGDEFVMPSPELSGVDLWVAAVNRAAAYFGVAVLVAVLLRRERRLRTRIDDQDAQLQELASLRAVLTPPPDLPARPGLAVATSFIPAERLVAGDFFLVVEGPMGSTTIVVGDVVGHGVEAARRASYVRAALATFATFSSDPVQLLQFANAALGERAGDRTQFVTAVCVNIEAPPRMRLRWACAGHDVPWSLDTGAPLTGGRVGVPLGLLPGVLAVESGCVVLEAGQGVVIFTDGLTEGRPARRDPSTPLELLGEDRVREIIRFRRGEAPRQVVNALVAALAEHAGDSLADDVCIVACRAESAPRPSTQQIRAG